MIIYRPYTYRLYHRPTQRYYYGSKTSNYSKSVANPDFLFVDYFTSSKTVKELILHYGIESFEIQKITVFETKEQACNWEAKFLKRINAKARANWINLHNGDGKFVNKGHSESTKEKMSAAARGRKKSPEHIEKIRESRLGKILPPWTEERRAKFIKSMTGKTRSDEAKRNISEAKKGKKLNLSEWALQRRREIASSEESQRKLAAGRAKRWETYRQRKLEESTLRL